MRAKAFIKNYPMLTVTVIALLAAAAVLGVKTIYPNTVELPFSPAVSSSAALSSVAAVVPLLPAPSSAAQTSSAAPVSSVPQKASSAPASSSSPNVSKAETSGFHTVEKSYFNDALFVGDSLTEGLHDYSGLENATYFYHVGLNIYQLFENPEKSTASGLTLEQTLRNKEYGKIYLMLGINEMGTGNTAYFARHYAAALQKIREIQPNALVYVQSILYVTKQKSEGDEIFNNPHIRERNAALKTLENRKNIFYLNINPVFDDGNGNMRAECSGDGIHPKAKYYRLWEDRLTKNAVPVG